MKTFKDFIAENHPDPDFAMRDFEQLCVLAEDYANDKAIIVLSKAAERAQTFLKKHNIEREGTWSSGVKESILNTPLD